MAGSMSRNKIRDTLLALKAAGLVAASAGHTIVDLKQGASSGSLGLGPEVMGEVLINVTALEIASNDESYDIILQGSPDANFGTAGNIVELAAIHLGAKETKRSDSDADDATGTFRMPFTNERNGTTFRYVRLYTVVAGTIATGINYQADIVKRSAL